MDEPNKSLSNDLASVLSLIKAREAEFLETVSKSNNSSVGQFFNQTTRSSIRILKVVRQYSN